MSSKAMRAHGDAFMCWIFCLCEGHLGLMLIKCVNGSLGVLKELTGMGADDRALQTELLSLLLMIELRVVRTVIS